MHFYHFKKKHKDYLLSHDIPFLNNVEEAKDIKKLKIKLVQHVYKCSQEK